MCATVVLDEVRLRAERGRATPRPSASVALARRILRRFEARLVATCRPARSFRAWSTRRPRFARGLRDRAKWSMSCGPETRGLEAVADRAMGERRVVLDAGEALLLDRGDELAVDDERRGGITVIRVDPEDVHRTHSAARRSRTIAHGVSPGLKSGGGPLTDASGRGRSLALRSAE